VQAALHTTFFVSTLVFAFMFATKDRDMSRLFLGSYLALMAVLLIGLNRFLPALLARLIFQKNEIVPILLIGRASQLGGWLRHRKYLGVRVVGVLSDDPWAKIESIDVKFLGPVSKLSEVLQRHHVLQVILTDWINEADEVERLIRICESEGCRFLIHNDYSARFARRLLPVEEGGHHFLALQQEPLEEPLNRALKRALDVAIALPVVLLILPPLTLLVWMGQRWQAPGPVFFVRPRGGQNRKAFPMCKYRTMHTHNPNVAQQATVNDPRIFPVGRFLRKSSLDEMPQFLNVLRGEMSVVGPRPHLPQHDVEFSQITRGYHGRSFVKPGITGLAQVRGYRGEITDPEMLDRRVYYDLYYTANWSFALDLKIILQTAWQVVMPPRSAY